jgi:hypothetical protein
MTSTTCYTTFAIVIAALAIPASAADVPSAKAQVQKDARHDFDWETGKWFTHVRRLQRPLSGSTSWVEYDGTTVVTPVLEGRANVAELRISGPTGRIEGAAMRIYQPDASRWAIHYFSVGDGVLGEPVFGRWEGGVGHFEGKDTLGDRAILVRFEIRETQPGHWHFEQAFSADEGRTWELNWIADDKRG